MYCSLRLPFNFDCIYDDAVYIIQLVNYLTGRRHEMFSYHCSGGINNRNVRIYSFAAINQITRSRFENKQFETLSLRSLPMFS